MSWMPTNFISFEFISIAIHWNRRLDIYLSIYIYMYCVVVMCRRETRAAHIFTLRFDPFWGGFFHIIRDQFTMFSSIQRNVVDNVVLRSKTSHTLAIQWLFTFSVTCFRMYAAHTHTISVCGTMCSHIMHPIQSAYIFSVNRINKFCNTLKSGNYFCFHQNF